MYVYLLTCKHSCIQFSSNTGLCLFRSILYLTLSSYPKVHIYFQPKESHFRLITCLYSLKDPYCSQGLFILVEVSYVKKRSEIQVHSLLDRYSYIIQTVQPIIWNHIISIISYKCIFLFHISLLFSIQYMFQFHIAYFIYPSIV